MLFYIVWTSCFHFTFICFRDKKKESLGGRSFQAYCLTKISCLQHQWSLLTGALTFFLLLHVTLTLALLFSHRTSTKQVLVQGSRHSHVVFPMSCGVIHCRLSLGLIYKSPYTVINIQDWPLAAQLGITLWCVAAILGNSLRSPNCFSQGSNKHLPLQAIL